MNYWVNQNLTARTEDSDSITKNISVMVGDLGFVGDPPTPPMHPNQFKLNLAAMVGMAEVTNS